MTLALARKWRPRTFGELVGQEHVVKALTNALTQNRLHHAYLFTGTRGVGKTTLARIVAKALNCETGVSATPCGKCSACTQIDAGRFVDLLELDAASNTQVDAMRELLEGALYAPSAGRFKVYIIDEVHMLSRSAFNAMLKTLEEPPGHVKFILATTDPQKVPVTVLSRCLQFNLKQIPPGQIRTQLEHILAAEGVNFEAAALALLARAAEGSLRDALSLLDQAIAHGAGKVEEIPVRDMLGVVDRRYLFEILKALARGDGRAMFNEAENMAARSLSFDAALQELATLVHRIALLQSVPEALAEDDPEREVLRELSGIFTPEDVQLYYQIAILGRRDMGLAPDEFAGFTMTLMRMLTFRLEEPQGDAPTRPSPARSAPVPQTQEPKESRAAPMQTQTGSVETQLSNWRDLMMRLKIGGMARMLADHCQFQELQGERLALTISDAHKHLVEKNYVDKLQAALEEHFGSRLRLSVSIGAVLNSPAKLNDRDKQVQIAAAIESIDADPFVRELVETFDARIKDSSIKPHGIGGEQL
ncbi:MAG: DNA polymerase III subunit gamma/tau [Burkholderiales bacterium]